MINWDNNRIYVCQGCQNGLVAEEIFFNNLDFLINNKI